jgi:phosphatidylglycerophosphate synthase
LEGIVGRGGADGGVGRSCIPLFNAENLSEVNHYQPTSRRPIADAFRATARQAVNLCVRWSIHPDAVSYASVVAAGAAGAAFWFSGRMPWLLVVAPLFCYVRLWMNMLDGMVALASGKASPRGEILNDLPDRVSDVIIFAGVAHSGWCNPFLAYWSAIFALMTAYVGTLGQAVGVQREFSGVMSKPWRMVMLNLGAYVALGAWLAGNGRLAAGGLTVVDFTCLIVIAGCVQTIVIRLARIMAALRRKQGA